MHNAWCYACRRAPTKDRNVVLSWAIWGSWPRSSGLKPPTGGDSIPKKMILRRKNIFPPAMRQFHYYLLLDLPIKNRHSYIMVYPNFPMFLLCVSYFAQKFCMNIPWFSQVITASPWQLAQYLVADASHRRLLLSAAARSAATAAWELAEAGVRCSTVCPFFWATMVKQQIQRINIDKYLQWYWYVSLQRRMIHYNYIELLFLDCAVMSRTRCSQT